MKLKALVTTDRRDFWSVCLKHVPAFPTIRTENRTSTTPDDV